MKKILYGFLIFALCTGGVTYSSADVTEGLTSNDEIISEEAKLESIDAVTSPTAAIQFKDKYIVGAFLDFQVLTVKLTYSDGSYERIPYPEFKKNGISVTPHDGFQVKEVGDMDIVFEKDGVIGKKKITVTRKQFTIEDNTFAKGKDVLLYGEPGDTWYDFEMNNFLMEIADSEEAVKAGEGKVLKRKEDYNLAPSVDPKGTITVLDKTIKHEGDYYIRLSGSVYETRIFKISVNSQGEKTIEEVRDSFNVGFYTGEVGETEIQEVAKGEKAIKPQDPVKEGFKFKGWFIDNDETKPFDFDTEIRADYKVFAKWEESGKSITLVGGKGTLTENIEESLKDFTLNRLSGANRYQTSVEVSKLYDSSKTVILASGEQYTDKLTATVLANTLESPILLTRKDSLPEEIGNELERLNAEDVIIIGGTGTISENVEKQLLKYNIERVGGANRFETAVLVGDKVLEKSNNKTEIALVDGTNYADAIAMSSLASKNSCPILLTNPKGLNGTTKEAIDRWNITNVTIGGGTGSVSESIEAKLKETTTVERISGANRYETAVKIAEKTYPESNNIVIASGENYPDAIVGANYSAKNKYPILLSRGNDVPQVVMDYINK